MDNNKPIFFNPEDKADELKNQFSVFSTLWLK